MHLLSVKNPFNAPVYFEETLTSTQEVSHKLAAKGSLHGTVIAADFQTKGRGRGQNRSWLMERKTGLAFTVLLRYQDIEHFPAALSLRCGLAVLKAIEDFTVSLIGRLKIKWPNDILIREQGIGSRKQKEAIYKKAAGILCTADGTDIHAGIGVNVLQKDFPQELQEKATSLALASDTLIAHEDRFLLLEKILSCLYTELNQKDAHKPRLEQYLYKKGEPITFINGAAPDRAAPDGDSNNKIEGILAGITDKGEILIYPSGCKETFSFTTGEIVF